MWEIHVKNNKNRAKFRRGATVKKGRRLYYTHFGLGIIFSIVFLHLIDGRFRKVAPSGHFPEN